jgi:hypothetical protein
MDQDKVLRDLAARVNQLEREVFGRKQNRRGTGKALGSKGPTMGIRQLVSRGYFAERKKLSEVRSALAKNGYHYSVQAVDIALRRLGKRNGPLVLLKEAGRNLYVNRK